MKPIGPFSPLQFRKDPYSIYAQLRVHSPVHFFETGFWMISRYKDVVDALKQPDLFSSRTGIWASTPVGEDPPLHTILRKGALKILSQQKTTDLEERIRQINDDLLGKVLRQQEFDLMDTVAGWLPFTVISEILGLPEENRIQSYRWLHSLKHNSLLENLFAGLAIWEKVGQDLSLEQKVRFTRFLLSAATLTSSNLIGNAIHALLKNPEQMELVLEDRELVPALVEEALRYDTPAPLAARRPVRDTEINGIPIPAGAEIFLLLASANRDPEVFEYPDRFLVTRDASKHIAFGDGTHYCLGAQLARMEAQIALEGLLFRLKGLRAVQPLDSVEYVESAVIRGLKSFVLTFDREIS